MEKVDIQIRPVHVMEKKHKLVFFESGKMILKQFETKSWSEQDFVFVKQQIDQLL